MEVSWRGAAQEASGLAGDWEAGRAEYDSLTTTATVAHQVDRFSFRLTLAYNIRHVR